MTGYDHDKSDVFANIYFNGDKIQKEKVLELAFKYFSYFRGSSDFLSFLRYVNEEKFNSIMNNRILENEEAYNSGVRSEHDFCSRLRNDVYWRSDPLGLEYWEKYIDCLPLLKESSSYYDEQLFGMASKCLIDVESSNEKLAIINDLIRYHKYLNPENSKVNGVVLQDFLRIVLQAFPNISFSEAKDLVPEKYYEDWKYMIHFWRRTMDHKPEKNGITNFEKIELFKEFGYLEDVEFDNYDLYRLRRWSDHINVELVKETGQIMWFDTDGYNFPMYMDQLIEFDFKPILNSIGLNVLFESSYNTKDRNFNITFKTASKVYKSEYVYSESIYRLEPFFQSINHILRDINSDYRLFQVDYGDQTIMLGLFKPNIFLPIAKDLNINCYILEVPIN